MEFYKGLLIYFKNDKIGGRGRGGGLIPSNQTPWNVFYSAEILVNDLYNFEVYVENDYLLT